jgi:hypothetical protein
LTPVAYANAAFTLQPSAYIDLDGNRVTPFWSYSNYLDYTRRAGDGALFAVSEFEGGGNGVGALNINGAEVIPLRFDLISNFLNGAALAFASNEPRVPVGVALVRETSESGLPAAGRLIKVEIDGKRLVLPDADPVIENGRTLAPMRYIFETLGAEVEWNASDRSVTGTKDGAEIRLVIDSPSALVNGAEVALDTPPVLRSGRTLVPVRFIAESLGAEVEWDAARRTVVIRAGRF